MVVEEILAVFGSGAVTGLVTFGMIKSDLSWIKKTLDTHHERITTIENTKGKCNHG